MTNGGGVREDQRRKKLSKNFGVEVSLRRRARNKLKNGPLIPSQLSATQLVQSHTPLQNFVEEYRHKPVLICGGYGDSGRRIAESYVGSRLSWQREVADATRYGLEQAYILQDIVAWKQSVWDRYHLTTEEQSFVKVRRCCDLQSHQS